MGCLMMKIEDGVRWKKNEEWWVPGYGTEKVGPFLESLVGLARPQRILELGMGYTTPFLLNGLKENTEGLLWDGNCDKDYLDKPYSPKFVVVDDLSMEDDQAERRLNILKNEPLVEFIQGDMRDSEVISKISTHGPYDLVWVDCGGWEEYKFFAENYWHMVKEYVLFHFTYFKGEPNKNLEVVSQLPAAFRMDIIEPHKFRQGSITMLRKV